MNEPVFVVDYFRDIVDATENFVKKGTNTTLLQKLQLVDPKITGIHYEHGHPIEIVETITEKGEGVSEKFNRFPLVGLLQDFKEEIGSSPGFYADGTFDLIICAGTDPNFKAQKRYDVNFKPILYPIYFALMEAIRLSRKFELDPGAETFSHTKIDRLYWGRQGLYGMEGNVMNDRVDCIEIDGLKLRIKQQNC